MSNMVSFLCFWHFCCCRQPCCSLQYASKAFGA